MKRQQSMFQFVRKARRTANHPDDTPLASATETETNAAYFDEGMEEETVTQEKRNIHSTLDIVLRKEMNTASAPSTELNTCISSDCIIEDKNTASDTGSDTPLLPDCWSMRQYDSFKLKYDGLIAHDKKLGCLHCAKFDSLNIKGIHIAIEWKKCGVVASGKNKTTQQASLRKKMNEHFTSKAHAICVNQIDACQKDAITKSIDKANEKYMSSTCKVFNTVYSLAKRSRPFSDIEAEIELQIKNGVDMGVGLHSRKTAVKIVDHMAKDIRGQIFSTIMKEDLKLCVIVDEASTISSNPVLIVYVKIENCKISPTIFLELVELEGQGAETIHRCLLKCLHNVGFTMEYLQRNLIAFCSDGASVMLGRSSGVGVRLMKDFPNIIIWHCLNHRLQLVLDDSVKEIKQINHFKIFMDKIYAIFHQSNINQMELYSISEQLGQEILKIGRVLGPRWAACSLRAAQAVWRDYAVLHEFFSSNTKFAGMANRMSNKYFVNDLALMLDILQEISLLSNALQARSVSLPTAEKLIKRTIKAFEILKKGRGQHEKQVDAKIASDNFKKIDFSENSKFVSLPREKLLNSIISNMHKRLMDSNHLLARNNDEGSNLVHEVINLVEPQSWNIEEVTIPWFEAEEKLGKFEEIFSYKINVNDYRDFVENVVQNAENHTMPPSIRKAKNIINTIAISSAEAERGFSKMNVIYGDKRSRLLVENVSNLMTIDLLGLPLEEYDPTSSVRSWLRQNHSADDSRVKLKKAKEYNENQVAIWNYLK